MKKRKRRPPASLVDLYHKIWQLHCFGASKHQIAETLDIKSKVISEALKWMSDGVPRFKSVEEVNLALERARNRLQKVQQELERFKQGYVDRKIVKGILVENRRTYPMAEVKAMQLIVHLEEQIVGLLKYRDELESAGKGSVTADLVEQKGITINVASLPDEILHELMYLLSNAKTAEGKPVAAEPSRDTVH